MRSYVISLERRPERLREFRACFPGDWPFARPELFEGSDGNGCELPDWWQGRAGSWGCTQSHVRVLERHVQEAAGEDLLVFEDDARPIGDDCGLRAAQFLAGLPADCDVAYLGGQLMLVSRLSPVRIADDLYRVRDVCRTHAIFYSPRGAELALECLRGTDWPATTRHFVDYRLMEIDSQNIYAPARWLFGQAAGESDVAANCELEERRWCDPTDLALAGNEVASWQ